MARKKEDFAKITFADLKERAKEVEGLKTMNRFELICAIKKAESSPICPKALENNPRAIKPKMAKIKEAYDKIGKSEKKQRSFLRAQLTKLKRLTRTVL